MDGDSINQTAGYIYAGKRGYSTRSDFHGRVLLEQCKEKGGHDK